MLRLNDGSGSTVSKAARVNSSHMVQLTISLSRSREMYGDAKYGRNLNRGIGQSLWLFVVTASRYIFLHMSVLKAQGTIRAT